MAGPIDDFVERLGLIAEEQGFPQIAGRIMAFLLVHEGPFSLDELAEQLRIGKTSASTNARLLEQTGILTRTINPGDRRDFYRIADDHWEGMFVVARRRLQRLHDVLTEAERSLPAELESGRRRVKQSQRFYSFLLQDLDTKVERWRRYQQAGEAGPEHDEPDAVPGGAVTGQEDG